LLFDCAFPLQPPPSWYFPVKTRRTINDAVTSPPLFLPCFGVVLGLSAHWFWGVVEASRLSKAAKHGVRRESVSFPTQYPPIYWLSGVGGFRFFPDSTQVPSPKDSRGSVFAHELTGLSFQTTYAALSKVQMGAFNSFKCYSANPHGVIPDKKWRLQVGHASRLKSVDTPGGKFH